MRREAYLFNELELTIAFGRARIEDLDREHSDCNDEMRLFTVI